MNKTPNGYALLSINVIQEKKIIPNGFIKIRDGKIIATGSMENYEKEDGLIEKEFTTPLYAAPGFIDIHIHGLNGADTMDASEEALTTMAQTLPKEGTTSFLATTITQDKEPIEAALLTVHSFIEEQANNHSGSSELLGIHLEGPFISKKRAGAQPLTYIIDPCISTFSKWQKQSGNNIKVVTLAPELTEGTEFIQHLHQTGVIASIGHSDAVYSEMVTAIEAGASHVTHFYNGMRGIHHREPGVVGAGLAHQELFVEMIADGIHVHPAVIKATFLAKGSERMILITDSMRAKWLIDGEYELGGQKVLVENNTALLEDGTLAGSVLKMNDAVRNMIEYTNCSITEAIQMASSNPAKRLNVWDRKGSIEAGKDADIVLFNEEIEIILTICNGKITYKGAN
ncbi:N-acetylglucosamine-6-phosphate deacetylase [Sutcliffiella halmapala]|uniref:N-acetylglucosamine-6-phosphate deacetylase n=1 Tax=Sutcliffiella halmapala TaxID=79882 RepID=UPI0009958DE4|nr:N-acetylglucosamine-6-phosphate deacetylase [Sutcliffiella halmapala]